MRVDSARARANLLAKLRGLSCISSASVVPPEAGPEQPAKEISIGEPMNALRCIHVERDKDGMFTGLPTAWLSAVPPAQSRDETNAAFAQVMGPHVEVPVLTTELIEHLMRGPVASPAVCKETSIPPQQSGTDAAVGSQERSGTKTATPTAASSASSSLMPSPEMVEILVDESPWDSHSEVRTLGNGAFGLVKLGKDNKTGAKYAFKEAPMSQYSDVREEMELHERCAHENVVGLKRMYVFQDWVWLQLDFCTFKSLASYVGSDYPWPEMHIAYVTRSLLSALAHCHKVGVIHADVKTDNVLVNASGKVLLCDFGLAHDMSRGSSGGVRGTNFWMAPEVIKQMDGYSLAPPADVWSLAITVIELAQGDPPYFQEDATRAPLLIAITDPPMLLKDPVSYSVALNDFIGQAARFNPEERATAEDLLGHHFLSESMVPTQDSFLQYMCMLKEERAKKRLFAARARKEACETQL